MNETSVLRILVVEDDPSLATSLQWNLEFEGYDVRVVHDGNNAWGAVQEYNPHVIILDVGLPHSSGITICRKIRAEGLITPILMLTAKDSTADQIVGLDAGADDYVTKPFVAEELMARLRAMLRRMELAQSAPADRRLTVGHVTLDPDTYAVTSQGHLVDLTPTEFSLLRFLMERTNRVQTREYLMSEVWGYDHAVSMHTLEVYVGYLRRKLEAFGQGRIVHTVRGVGFVARHDDSGAQ